MEYIPHILALLGVWVVVVITPGPNFLAVTHHALSHSRKSGVFCAFGVAAGTVVWALSAVFGMVLILQKVGWAYDGVRITGACYLIYIGLKALRGSARLGPTPAAATAAKTGGIWYSFRSGLLVDLSNPKAATFFTSLFVVMLPPEAPLAVHLAVVVAVVVILAAWYSLAAFIVSLPPVARVYKRVQGWIDRVAGALFVFFGGKLLLSR